MEPFSQIMGIKGRMEQISKKGGDIFGKQKPFKNKE